MNSFSIKLNSTYHSLTYKEVLIADYLRANKNKLGVLSSYDLAEKLGVGQSTIIRFSQKLGYESFKMLLLDMMKDDDGDESNEVQVDESTYETKTKVKDAYLKVINLTYDANPPEKIDQVVDALSGAGRILCYGLENSSLYAEYLANKLLAMGLNAYAPRDHYIAMLTLKQLKRPNDVLFLISESGESRPTLEIAGAARQYGLHIVALTRASKNSLQKMATITLNIVKYEANTLLNATANRCSQLYLIDLIYLTLFKRDYSNYRNEIIEGERLLEKEMNVKKKNRRSARETQADQAK